MIYKSYYKLLEIDKKYNIIKTWFIIELGCFPGGWSRYIKTKKNFLLKIDLKEPIIKKRRVYKRKFCFF